MPTPPRMLLVLSENWTLTGGRADPPAAVRWAREAEDAGFEAVMVSEHIVLGPDAAAAGIMGNPRDYAHPGNQDPYTPWPNSLLPLAAIASVTSRLRLAAAAVLAPLRHPLLLARELGTLDLLHRERHRTRERHRVHARHRPHPHPDRRPGPHRRRRLHRRRGRGRARPGHPGRRRRRGGARPGRARHPDRRTGRPDRAATPAWQDFADDWKGTVEPGRAADLCVLDRPLLGLDPHDITELQVDLTVFDGRVVFER